MVNELQARLHSLYNGRTPLGGIGPQMVGLERYRLVASGEQLYTLLEAADRIGALEGERAEFQNFHRLLCERFGYVHDPFDWKRDQLSLIEHIAKQSSGEGK